MISAYSIVTKYRNPFVRLYQSICPRGNHVLLTELLEMMMDHFSCLRKLEYTQNDNGWATRGPFLCIN